MVWCGVVCIPSYAVFRGTAYQIYAGVCWALVMYLFHFQKGTLQPSLISSMTYLYLDSNTWPNTNENGIIEWLMK